MPDIPTAPNVGAFPAGFAGFLSGFSSNLYIQPGNTTALSTTQLGSRDLSAVAVADAAVSAIIAPANNLNPQSIGSLAPGTGSDVVLPLQGARYANRLPIQTAPNPVSLTITYDVSNAPLVQLSVDGNNSVTNRTAVVVSTLIAGASTYNWIYSFNFRATPINWTIGPDNAHLANIVLVPLGGNQFGYSYTTSP